MNTEIETLIENTIAQIEEDLKNSDTTAIFELLKACPRENLESFLSEV